MATGAVLGVIALVGAGVSAYGQYQSGQTQSAIADFNAKQQERQARLGLMSTQAQANTIKQQAEANYRMRAEEAKAKESNAVSLENQAYGQDRINRSNDKRRREDFNRMQGEQRAAIGASGVVEASGTPLDLLAETAAHIQLDQEEQHYSAELDRRTIFRQADMERLGGKFALAGATLDRDAGLAESGLVGARGRMEYLSGVRSAEITRLTGRAARTSANFGALGTILTGASSAYGQAFKAS